MLVSNFMMASFYLICIFEILPLLLQDCLSSGNTSFTVFAVLQGICGSTLQLYVLRLRKWDFANSTCYIRQTRRLSNSGLNLLTKYHNCSTLTHLRVF